MLRYSYSSLTKKARLQLDVLTMMGDAGEARVVFLTYHYLSLPSVNVLQSKPALVYCIALKHSALHVLGCELQANVWFCVLV